MARESRRPPTRILYHIRPSYIAAIVVLGSIAVCITLSDRRSALFHATLPVFQDTLVFILGT